MTTDSAILVVDDDRDACETLSDLLSDFGYAVDVAGRGEEALELAGRKAYRLALLDFRMPGLDGVETFRRLRGLRDGIEGLLVTAHADAGTAERAAEAGVRRVFPKPLDVPKLLPLVDEIMSEPA